MLNNQLDEEMEKISKLDDTDKSVQEMIDIKSTIQGIRNELNELTISPKRRFGSYLNQGWPTKQDWPIHHEV